MAQLFTNNAAATLASGINSSASTCTVASGKGALFPSPNNGDYAILTLTQAGATETSWEEVLLVGRSGDVLTIERAYEGSTALAWAAGSKIELRITAQTMTELMSASSAAVAVPGLVASMAAYHPPVKHINGTTYSIVTTDNHGIIILNGSSANIGIADWLPDGARVTLVNNSGGTATLSVASNWTLFVAGYAYKVSTVKIPARGVADLINLGEGTGWPSWVASGPGLTYT